jgi:hypothetical protein
VALVSVAPARRAGQAQVPGRCRRAGGSTVDRAQLISMADDTPMKSAYELAMERLKQKDEAAGVARAPLTDDQRAAIAEIRSVYQARLAEIEILHRGRVLATPDPEARVAIDDDYRRERERLNAERDAKIERAHADRA